MKNLNEYPPRHTSSLKVLLGSGRVPSKQMEGVVAIFSFLIGCMIGLVSAVVGWAGFDMSILSAFGLYLSVSLLVGMALILTTLHTLDHDCAEVDA